MSPKVILSAFHCTVDNAGDPTKSCDHSDGKRVAVFGRHEFHYHRISSYYTIPVIKVLSPPHTPMTTHDDRTHDFALLLLQHPAKYSGTVSPICLPQPHDEFSDLAAIAAGWGRTDKATVNAQQSPVLRMVQLTVSPKKYRHTKMFGTILSKKEHQYQDPCSGDSGHFIKTPNKLGLSCGLYAVVTTINVHMNIMNDIIVHPYVKKRLKDILSWVSG